jgi:hypothetical protein
MSAPAIGMTVRLDREIDRQRPCHYNYAIVCAGKPPHAAELRCSACNAHRGWLPKAALVFIVEMTARFGAPAKPLVLRNSTIGDHVMNKDFRQLRNPLPQ